MSGQRARKDRLRDERLAEEQAEAGGGKQQRKQKLGALIVALVAVGLLIALVLGGTSGAGSSAGSTPPLTKAQLAALPKHLAANEAQANQVIDGSIEDKLAALRGVPVVVNQWASWCPNCREEFPFFQQLSKHFRGRVAFVGLDSQDDRGSAEDFLQQYPVTYPSIYDHSASQAASIGGGQGWPTTIFYNSRGQRTYIRPGGYTTAATLRSDIERYALAKQG